jgi:hypothetical protein
MITRITFSYKPPIIAWVGQPDKEKENLLVEYNTLIDNSSMMKDLNHWQHISHAFQKILESSSIDESERKFFQLILKDITYYKLHLLTPEREKFEVCKKLKIPGQKKKVYQKQLPTPNFLTQDRECSTINDLVNDIGKVQVVYNGSCIDLGTFLGAKLLIERLLLTRSMVPVDTLIQHDGSCGFLTLFNMFTSPLVLLTVRDKVVWILQNIVGQRQYTVLCGKTHHYTALLLGYVILYRFQDQNVKTRMSARMLIRCVLNLQKSFFPSVSSRFLSKLKPSDDHSAPIPATTSLMFKLAKNICETLFPDGELLIHKKLRDGRYKEAAGFVTGPAGKTCRHAVTKLPSQTSCPKPVFVDSNFDKHIPEDCTTYMFNEHNLRSKWLLWSRSEAFALYMRNELVAQLQLDIHPILIEVKRLGVLQYLATLTRSYSNTTFYVKMGDASPPMHVTRWDGWLLCKYKRDEFKLYPEMFRNEDDWKNVQRGFGEEKIDNVMIGEKTGEKTFAITRVLVLKVGLEEVILTDNNFNQATDGWVFFVNKRFDFIGFETAYTRLNSVSLSPTDGDLPSQRTSTRATKQLTQSQGAPSKAWATKRSATPSTPSQGPTMRPPSSTRATKQSTPSQGAPSSAWATKRSVGTPSQGRKIRWPTMRPSSVTPAPFFIPSSTQASAMKVATSIKGTPARNTS